MRVILTCLKGTMSAFPLEEPIPASKLTTGFCPPRNGSPTRHGDVVSAGKVKLENVAPVCQWEKSDTVSLMANKKFFQFQTDKTSFVLLLKVGTPHRVVFKLSST